MDGVATAIHAQVGDSIGGGGCGDVEVQAGSRTSCLDDGPDLTCIYNGSCDAPTIEGTAAGFVDAETIPGGGLVLSFAPSRSQAPGVYTYTVDYVGSCLYGQVYLSGANLCTDGPYTVTVDPPPPPPAPPTVTILSRPIIITPTATPWQYTASLTSTVSPTGGCYRWGTTNSTMVQFSTSTNADQVTLSITSTNDKATITLTYTYPCDTTNSATDSFTFALGNDTTVVAWVNPNAVTVTIPPNDSFGPDPVFQDLELGGATGGDGGDPTISCGSTLLNWVAAGQSGVGATNNNLTPAEIAYANAFLLARSGNPPPPPQLAADQSNFVNNKNLYRLYQRFQAYYELKANGTIGNPTFLETLPEAGITPEPCSGFQIPIFSLPVERNTINGQSGLGSDGTLVYQVNEARLGQDGQAVNQFLNGPAGNTNISTVTP